MDHMKKPSELTFQSLVTLFAKCQEARGSGDKRGWLKKFNSRSILPYREIPDCDGIELYQVYRLLLPGVSRAYRMLQSSCHRAYLASIQPATAPVANRRVLVVS